MNIGDEPVKIFKMENRSGYAAICGHCLTEGRTSQEAYDRMVKAVKRTKQKNK